MAAIRERAARLLERIAAQRDPAEVTVVAMVKGFDATVAQEAVAAGLTELGESVEVDLVEKHDVAGAAVRWHFAGNIQRNKVARIAPLVGMWHSVDRVEEGRAIARVRPGASVLVQVNTTEEPQKGGCRPNETSALVAQLQELGLNVLGLTTIARDGPAEGARPAFRALADLGARLGLRELSMGMTNDLDVALEEGATILRVGTLLFGPRPATR